MTNTHSLPFIWVPGMRIIDGETDEAGTVVTDKMVAFGDSLYRTETVVRPRPDLGHGITVALLLEQLRERLGARVEVRACGDDPNDWAVMVGDAGLGWGRTDGQAILAALVATAPEPAKPRAIPTAADFEAVVRSLDKHVAVVEQLRARLISAGLVDGTTTADDFLGALPVIVDYLATEHRKLAAVEAALDGGGK